MSTRSGKSMQFLSDSGISSLFKNQSEKLKIWKEVERLSTRIEHTERPTAKALRDRLRELPQPADLDVGGDEGRELMQGPRGGLYYINSNGNKTYVRQK